MPFDVRATLLIFTRVGELPLMSKEAEYRANAANTLDLANRTLHSGDKTRLLELAEKWLDLAVHTHRLAATFSPKRSQHPLVQAKLGDEKHPDAE